MNRKERRRKAKLSNYIIEETKLGRVVFDIKPGDDTSRDICYVCGKPAIAWPSPTVPGGMAHGIASIKGQIVLICETCFNNTDETFKAIWRKYWNKPDIEFSEGGTYESADQIRRDIASATK